MFRKHLTVTLPHNIPNSVLSTLSSLIRDNRYEVLSYSNDQLVLLVPKRESVSSIFEFGYLLGGALQQLLAAYNVNQL